MDLSIIISTWNNSKRLAIALEAISQCKIPEGLRWELVVVNNNSKDDTAKVIENFARRVPIHYVFEPIQGLSIAKNTGLKNARGKFIIFTDDDVKPCAEWINIYWQAYTAYPRQTFFGGPVESEYEMLPNTELIKLAPYSVKGFNCGNKTHFLNEKNFISANWGAEKEILKHLGGFDSTKGLKAGSKKLVTGEEVDLMKRLRKLGWQALYLHEARLQHYVPANKCSVQHIASRVEAFSFEKIMASCKGNKTHILAETPMIANTLIRSLIRLSVDTLKGEKDSLGYVQWRRSLGYLKGVKESLIN